MTTRRAVVAFAALGIACGGQREPSGRAADSTPPRDAVSTGAGELRDDFSDPASGWRRRSGDRQGVDYEDGRYVLWVDNDKSSYVGASGWLETREFADTRFEVEATKLSGPAGAPVGVSCRQWSEGEKRGVYFADVDGEGEARLGLYDEQGQTVLATMEHSGLWRDGKNTLRLDCVGSSLAFFLNGEKLLTASNDRFARGRVGVRAGGTSSGLTRVAFDEAAVTVVEGGRP
jgi:hypothetical protein